MNPELLELQSNLLKALSHPTRLAILLLLREGEWCVCEMAEELGLEQPNLSQHLSVLRKQGIIEAKKRGLRVNYAVANPQVFVLLQEVEQLVREQSRAKAALFDEA